MSHRLTRALLIAVPTACWCLLLGITVTLTAEGHPPTGGLFSIGIVLVNSVTVGSLVLWVRGDARAHLSSELQHVSTALQDARVNFSADMATFFQMMSHRIDNLESPTVPIPRLAAVGAAQVPIIAAVSPPEPASSLDVEDPGLDVWLAETAEIYELGRQAGLAERDDPPPVH